MYPVQCLFLPPLFAPSLLPALFQRISQFGVLEKAGKRLTGHCFLCVGNEPGKTDPLRKWAVGSKERDSVLLFLLADRFNLFTVSLGSRARGLSLSSPNIQRGGLPLPEALKSY